jgi:hypothetical protein
MIGRANLEDQDACDNIKIGLTYVRFEVFTAVTMKNGFLWDDMTCGSCKNRRFGGT